MTSRTTSILAFGLIVLAAQVKGVKRVTVDAGTGHMANFILLFAGDEVLTIQGTKEFEIGAKSNWEIPEDMKVQALLSSGADLNLFFYGPEYGVRLDLRTRKTKNLRYGPIRKFLQGGGPDAAALKDGKAYFFKGCDMIRRFNWNSWGKPKNVAEIGLPCNPDAAWNIEGGSEMIVLKGDQIWRWDQDNNVDGPKSFSSMYTVTSWELIPSDEG